jgi:hypothetical protein
MTLQRRHPKNKTLSATREKECKEQKKEYMRNYQKKRRHRLGINKKYNEKLSPYREKLSNLTKEEKRKRHLQYMRNYTAKKSKELDTCKDLVIAYRKENIKLQEELSTCKAKLQHYKDEEKNINPLT